jgi:MFS family permease
LSQPTVSTSGCYNPWMKRLNPSQLRETFRISIAEGVFSQIFTNLAGPGSVFITKLLVMLNASPVHFGFLSAIGQLSLVVQPLGVAVTRRRARRKPVIILMAAVGRSMAPLLGILPMLLPAAVALPASLLLFMVFTALLSVTANMWIGWIADMVPLRVRGRFFARRNQVLMLVAVVVSYLFGAFVDLFSADRGWISRQIEGLLHLNADPGGLPGALLIVFSSAGVLGLAGLLILRKQPENPKLLEHESFKTILKVPFTDPNFRHLSMFGIWWMMAVGIGAPFWQPFMMQKLGMSVVEVLLYGTIATAGALMAVRPWGRFIDRYGNKPAMRIAIVMGSINPLMWLFVTRDTLWIIYSEALLCGVMWSCVGIVIANLVLSIAPESRRQIYSGVFNAVSGLAMMATMLASGLFMPGRLQISGLNLWPEQVLFLITAFARLSAEIPLSWVHEPQSIPVGELLARLQQYSKVGVSTLLTWLIRRGGRRS